MVLNTLGYNAISLQSETNNLKEELINKLRNRFKNIICFFDNDKTGIEAMEKIEIEHKIPFIKIDDIYNVKDIAEFIKIHGISKTRNFLYEKTKEHESKSVKCNKD